VAVGAAAAASAVETIATATNEPSDLHERSMGRFS
jgi:hypothetical protein